MEYEELVPAHIRALGSYAPGKPIKTAERETGVKAIKMASNENPFGPSPRALEAMRATAPEAHLYPDNDNNELRERLAALHGVKFEQTLVTGGTTSFLVMLSRMLLGPGLNAVTSERSFIVYPLATRAVGAEIVQVPMRNDGYDLDAILKAINKDTRIVFVANPNNPTGTLFDAAATDRFLDKVPDHVVVVLDEAYNDFAKAFCARKGIHYSHSIDYAKEGRKVVILRTFSKAHGLAGLRVGYGIADAKLLGYVVRLRTAFSVSAMAEAAAIAALDDEGHIHKAVENNTRGTDYLFRALSDLGYNPVETFANFIYVDVGEDSVAVAKRMEAEGVIIRPLKVWGAPNAIRITIGTPGQNERCISVLRKVMEKAAVR